MVVAVARKSEPASGAASPVQAKLRVAALEKRYGAFTALRPTDLSVSPGEFLTLLGPSGSGKTTLLMMIAGLTMPSGGEIWIDGRQSTWAPPYDRDVGVVFQNYALFPHLSVYENVAFPLRMRGTPSAEIRRQVERILEVVGLPHAAERLPSELSGGQQQRIALARCAVYGPSIILMDEPLGALDKKLRDTMQVEIKRMHREIGSTIIYVTHDQGEAMSMSNRICLMNNSAIEQIGRPEELYFNPVNRFVADFLGGTNFLRCTLAANDGEMARAQGPLGASFPVAVPAGTGLCAGAAVDVMLRPQHIRLASAADPSGCSLQAVITDRVVTGMTTEYHARLADGTALVAVDLTDRTARRTEIGDEVFLAWNALNGVALPVGEEAR